MRSRTGVPPLSLPAIAAAVLLGARTLSACPVCNSGTGREVRDGIFGPDFGRNVALTALPFPIFLGIAAAVYYGPPPWRKPGRDGPPDPELPRPPDA